MFTLTFHKSMPYSKAEGICSSEGVLDIAGQLQKILCSSNQTMYSREFKVILLGIISC